MRRFDASRCPAGLDLFSDGGTRELPLQAITYLGVLREYRHPHGPEAVCLGQIDHKINNVWIFLVSLPCDPGHPPCLATLSPSQITRPRVAPWSTLETDQLAQLFRPRSLVLGKAPRDPDDSFREILESDPRIVLVRPEIAVPREVSISLRRVAVDAREQEVRPRLFQVRPVDLRNHVLDMQISRALAIAAISAEPFQQIGLCIPIGSKPP